MAITCCAPSRDMMLLVMALLLRTRLLLLATLGLWGRTCAIVRAAMC